MSMRTRAINGRAANTETSGTAMGFAPGGMSFWEATSSSSRSAASPPPSAGCRSSRRPLHRSRLRSERGQAARRVRDHRPGLGLLVFGIIQFGSSYNNYIQMTNAADSGARGCSRSSAARRSAFPDVVSNIDNAAASLNVSNLVIQMTAPDDPA